MSAPSNSGPAVRRRRPIRRATRRAGWSVVVAAGTLVALGGWPTVPGAATSVPVAATVAAPSTATAATATTAAGSGASITAVDTDAALAAAVGSLGGHFAVAVTDLGSGAAAQWGADSFVTASIVKVDILAALLLRTGGELTDDQRAAAELMIEQSDNDAASALFEAAGGAAGLDAANARFGLTGTVAGTDGYWGLTSTTAADQARLLRAVFTADSPLDADSRAYLGRLMGLVADGQDWGVSAADQGGAAQLKNGWLPRTASGLWVVNSIGRVEYGGRDLLVAVLSDGSATQQDGIDLVESVASAAARALVAAQQQG
ncbi:serine hydrolase [Kitasatospora sp. NPDC088134]|uniref:serine hydrolase n=1 Tax=Kitasatospora sp. NPDC088134 TaxID=3364071 RepID=UPI0037F45190